MKKFDMRLLWGGLLIFAGAMFMLQEFRLIPSAFDFIWSVLFVIAGGVFLYAYFTDRAQWWPLIPGVGLLSLGAIILLEPFFPSANWLGGIFLGGLGLTFWLIYLLNRTNWWAIIPGGVLLTLALVAMTEDYFNDDVGGGIFMLGLSLTFVLVAVLPNGQGQMTWAFIPAGILALLGIFLISPLLPLIDYIWPVGLILLGAFFILRNFRPKG